MKKLACAAVLALLATAGPAAANDGPPKPGWEYSPEDFGIGRAHTGNAWCNRKIDAILEDTRRCFNTKAASQCEALQTRNSKKIGAYIKSPKCMRGKRAR